MELEREYERIVEHRATWAWREGRGTDRRRHPRLPVEQKQIQLSSGPEYLVLDLSCSGIAFSANYPLRRGATVTVTVEDGFSVQAQVVDCTLMESPTQYNDAEFRLHCRFLDEDAGMEMVVRASRRQVH